MGYRRIPTIYTFDNIPDEDGLIVRMKSIRFGKLRRLIALTDDDEADDVAITEIVQLMAESLVSWNLEDEEGNPVPANEEGLCDQDLDFIMKIVDAWTDRLTGSDGPNDLGKDSTDGGKFPGRPLMMEAL